MEEETLLIKEHSDAYGEHWHFRQHYSGASDTPTLPQTTKVIQRKLERALRAIREGKAHKGGNSVSRKSGSVDLLVEEKGEG